MILNMISGPRNISTAIMYSFAQHPDFEVVDEPFYGYYLKETGLEHPGRTEVLRTMDINESSIISSLFPSQKEHLFIKNMAHHLIMVHDLKLLREWKNIFLIRDPAKLIHSFSQVIEKPTLRDIGIKDEYDLYQEVSVYQKPVVIDSDELLKKPSVILDKILTVLNIRFDKKMLHWKAGPIKEDGVWAKYWYKNVHSSTGFAPYQEKEINLHGYLLDLYHEALPYYMKLSNHTIKF